MARGQAIFISYRRADTKDVAGRLYDRVENEFGRALVFKDVDSIPHGMPFKEYICGVLGGCKVVLALIGPTWLDQRDENGTRRLDDPNDLVRVEIESALNSKVQMIPVLVNDAAMPAASALPETLRPLAALNAARLRVDPDFRIDCDRLLRSLRAGPMKGARGRNGDLTKRVALAGGAAGAVAVAFALWRQRPDDADLRIRDGFYLESVDSSQYSIELSVQGGSPIRVSPTPVVERGGLRQASVFVDEYGRTSISAEFNDRGAAQMRSATSANAGRRLVLVAYGTVVFGAVIQSQISERLQITGDFTESEAKALAGRLNRALK